MVNEGSRKFAKLIKQLGLALSLMLCLVAMTKVAGAVPNGGYRHPEILIQPEELKARIDRKEPNLKIVDVREKLPYLSGHIPGAVQVWRPDIEDRMHVLPGMMASQKQVEDLMGGLGIDNKSIVVIYSDGPDNGRLWWVLAYYGFPIKQMKLLDGGIDAWKAKGYPVEIIPPKVERTILKLPKEAKRVKTILCSLPDVKSALRKPDKVILDTRSKGEFWGEETKKGATRSGRIPGAIWVEWKEVLVEDGPYKGYWKPAEEIKKIFFTKGVTPDEDIYIY